MTAKPIRRPRLSRRVRPAAVAASLLLAGLAGCTPSSPASNGLRVIGSAPRKAPGYDRSCASGRLCVFGTAWTDATTGTEWSRDGCDTRNQALKRDLRNVQIKPDTRGCVVLSGDLTDPYSGDQVQFRRSAGSPVSVDHIYPLATAWSRGASTWSLEVRKRFANDPANLLTTTAAVNSAKSDKMPNRWMPATASGRCLYAKRLITVALTYQLPVTSAENQALNRALRDCP